MCTSSLAFSMITRRYARTREPVVVLRPSDVARGDSQYILVYPLFRTEFYWILGRGSVVKDVD